MTQNASIRFPFEDSFEKVAADPEPYITAVFSSLASDFITMPKGPGFVEYPVFEKGYEHLKRVTAWLCRL